MTLHVVLVDDHEIMREGLCILLGKYEDIEVVGQAGDGRAAIELVDKLDPDIVIMDVAMPNLNGIEATRQMIELHPNLKVMALSAHLEGNMVGWMIKAGASGYMHKESAFAELKEGITAILEGQTFFCSRISKILHSDCTIGSSNLIKYDGVTLREREVLKLIAEGHSSKAIAQILKLRTKTVESHREHIMEKLKIHTIPGLTKYAVRNGLTIP